MAMEAAAYAFGQDMNHHWYCCKQNLNRAYCLFFLVKSMSALMLNGRTRISPARKISMNALDLVSADPMRGELFLAGS